MTKEQELKFEELCKDKVFVEKLMKCETPESAQELSATNGIELDIDEIKELCEILNKCIEKIKEKGDELSEEDLEEITGGYDYFTAFMDTLSIIRGFLELDKKFKNIKW